MLAKQIWEGGIRDKADCEDPHWQSSHWGVHYPRLLLALKHELDPQGLLYRHYAVESELWSDDGNCWIERAPGLRSLRNR
jgi:hypothetical protein